MQNNLFDFTLTCRNHFKNICRFRFFHQSTFSFRSFDIRSFFCAFDQKLFFVELTIFIVERIFENI